MERDIVLILEEGVMQGVFGAGVVTALSESGIHGRVHSVYGVSAGAHNGAYFLSRQTRFGSSIYFEDLAGPLFISYRKAPRFLLDVLHASVNRNHQVRNVVEMDYLTDHIESHKKKLAVEEIRKQPTRFFVRVYDVDACSHVLLDAKADTLQAIKASSSAAPYYARAVEINGRRYIDGSAIRSKGFMDVIREHSDKTVIYVRNRNKTHLKTMFEYPGHVIESLFYAPIFGWRVVAKKIAATFSYPSEQELRSFPNVRLAINRRGYRTAERNAEKLHEIFDHGYAEGKKVLNGRA
ncbi:MAG: patatin-like phospholipase family protein [Patescibacteria group bacterium]